jgi:hypothetical protein
MTWPRAPAAASGADRTHDLLSPPAQKVSGSSDQIALQSAALLQAASGWLPRVRCRSGATQTHHPTAATKKTCKCRPSEERLMGFEPTTFCMAISSCRSQIIPKCLQIDQYFARLIPGWASKNCAEIPGV